MKKTLSDLLCEATNGDRDDRERFACQFNRVSNLLHREYGVDSVHMTFIVRDIIVRILKGEIEL